MKPSLTLIIFGVGLVVGAIATASWTGAKADDVSDRYIVMFDQGQVTDIDAAIAELQAAHGDVEVGIVFQAIGGFSARMSEASANAIAEDPRVVLVEQVQVGSGVTQWGDINCDGQTDTFDVLDILRQWAQLPYREGLACRPPDDGIATG